MPDTAVHRIEVRPQHGHVDPVGAAACRSACAVGAAQPRRVDSAHVYLIEGALDDTLVERIASELLADPVLEVAARGASTGRGDAVIEVHPLPGVMDPDAEAIETAINAMTDTPVRVVTGKRYDFHGIDTDEAAHLAGRCLANPVVHAIYTEPFVPDAFPHGHPTDTEVRSVSLLNLDASALKTLSRDGHLFLSVDEMLAIQDEYRELGREPREIELETLAQTWSEHCVHKTLKARVRYRADAPASDPLSAEVLRGRPGITVNDDGSVTIDNLLRSTVAAATHALMHDDIDWCLSVFKDNAGIIAFDDDHAVCFKVETHNHPSALEPYGGAATGIGGCIRDIIGTGLAAKPIAATDVFCVAHPDQFAFGDADDSQHVVPTGCLHPRRILRDIVAGVRDYGNRMGIPTINGAVWFHNDYVGNPLVYCGCVGVMPRDAVEGEANPGDHIIALGGRTGRDGIHGATFSSAELTDSHADEFSHAVQIGNPVTEKKTLDVILAARDHEQGCLYSAITDCGAGGFSSAVGEMGEQLGAEVHLERAPLKYDGLTPTEIWISEAQERMVLAVPKDRVDALAAICDAHDVEWCDLGTFGTDDSELILRYNGVEFGRLPMELMHNGLPDRLREAAWTPTARSYDAHRSPGSLEQGLRGLLAHPNIASKHWIIRQYDHEVQGGAVINPLVGAHADGPSDAAVILPVEGSSRGLGMANGIATGFCEDAYTMTLLAIDECVRNLVCTGIDPARVAILDNFCWPGCDDEQRMGELVRASVACYDGAMAYRTPFISGKDSLNNQFTTEDGTTIRIPPTMLISGFGIVDDVERCITMDLKHAGNRVLLVSGNERTRRGSHYEMCFGRDEATMPATVDLERGPAVARVLHALTDEGMVRSAHDVSDGGVLVAVAEMAMAGRLGVHLERPADTEPLDFWFGEGASNYVIECEPGHYSALLSALREFDVTTLGTVTADGRLTEPNDSFDCDIDELRRIWLKPLDWGAGSD
ncbi:MAG: phosphoribosylformylglycinamidine synthase subunit PurS [Planctomycetota bacterium]